MTHHYVDTFIPGCDQASFPVRIEIPKTPGAAPSATSCADESAHPRGAIVRPPVSEGES